MPDKVFADARLAQVYDAFHPDRRDLDAYAAIVAEFDVRWVLDIGCGTGTFACMLAERGVTVTGLDPALASLDVARAKANAGLVDWVHGDITALPPLQVDMAIMTGNVAQVFLEPAEWAAVLEGANAALRPGGRLVFETRDPSRRAWEGWTPDETRTRLDIPGVGPVEQWYELVGEEGELVTFLSTFKFASDGATLESSSTLRFRSRVEIESSLAAAGFQLEEVRDAPDRPGLEWVFVARRAD
jgi:SAM-dependent methyltransferase